MSLQKTQPSAPPRQAKDREEVVPLKIHYLREAGTSFPGRVWEQDETGWHSREATAEDALRRRQVAEWLQSRL
jgi:hypothetical protein